MRPAGQQEATPSGRGATWLQQALLVGSGHVEKCYFRGLRALEPLPLLVFGVLSQSDSCLTLLSPWCGPSQQAHPASLWAFAQISMSLTLGSCSPNPSTASVQSGLGGDTPSCCRLLL